MKSGFLIPGFFVVLGLAASGRALAQDGYEYVYDFGEACG